MRLMKLSEYRRIVYAKGSEPSMNTLRKHIGEIPGGTIMHGHYYVDMDKLEQAVDLRAGVVAKERALAQDPDLAELM